jgi:hypothetical protein|tara:strand:- start:101 stop:355 length:255 start_codon:yes stop_codon:yes gene_type:complete
MEVPPLTSLVFPHKLEELNMSTDVYYKEQKEDIPEIEVDMILVLSRYEGGNLSSPSARREIARELHRELLSKNYVKRQKRDSGA